VRRHLHSLGRQTLVYGVSAAALQIMGVVTLPVFARTFSPAEYGVLEIVLLGLSAMLVIADLGMASASQRSYFDYTDGDATERRAVLATALVMGVATASLIAVLLIAFREAIARWLVHDEAHTGLVVLVAVTLPVAIVAAFLREVMRLRFMAGRYSISAIAGAVVAAAVGVGLVLGTDEGVKGVLIGMLAGNAVAVVVGLAGTAGFIGTRLSRKELRTMLAFGLPLIPAAFAMWGLAFLDRLMLSRLADLDEVGQYAVGGRLASVLMLVVTAFGLAYAPFMLSLFSEDREVEKQVRGRTLTYVAIVLTTISLVLALFAREVITVVAPGYSTAYQVVGVLCLGVTVFGLSSVIMGGISLARRSGYFATFSGIALAVNVALNAVLIPPLGGFGAGLATACAYVLLAGLYYRKSQQLYPTPFEPQKVLAVVLLGAAALPLGFLPLGPEFVALKLVGLLMFVLGLFATRVIGHVEIVELKSLLRRLTGSAEAKASGV
jgi:O-antigen/teichoic acid export membrane protein